MKKIQNLKKDPQKLQPNSEDEEIWQEEVEGIAKIKTPNRDLSKPEFIPKEIFPSVDVFSVYQGDNLGWLSPGDIANIDANTIKRFKRGEFHIESRLDLHGKIVNDAHDLVENFIHKSYQRGLRCVQIVTGKGLHRDDDLFSSKGVLRDLVPQWLNQDNIRPLILTFDYSLPKDGGDGAVSIFLRRNR